jgi:elongator complex protein 3
MLYTLTIIPPWIRVNRIQRDFPGNYIEGGNKVTNLRQVLDDKMKEYGLRTQEIRSNEVRSDIEDIHKARLVRVDYIGSEGLDVFLSHKSCNCDFCWKYAVYRVINFIAVLFGLTAFFYGCGNENKIYSFLRLRMNKHDYKNCFSEIYRKKAKLRELHVYGSMNDTYSKNENKETQHIGFGKNLLNEAEKIAKFHRCDGIMVIAGIGTRNYYRKFGYEIPYEEKNNGGFMIKTFTKK